MTHVGVQLALLRRPSHSRKESAALGRGGWPAGSCHRENLPVSSPQPAGVFAVTSLPRGVYRHQLLALAGSVLCAPRSQ